LDCIFGEMKKSKKSSGSSVKSHDSGSVVSQPSKDRRTATRDALLASRRVMRSSSPGAGNQMTLDPVGAQPLVESQGASGILPPAPPSAAEGGQSSDMAVGVSAVKQGQGTENKPLTLTTLDVAQSAERLMMSGYKFDIDENLASNPGTSFQTAPENLSGAINMMEGVVNKTLGVGSTVGPGVGVGNPTVFVRTDVVPLPQMAGVDNLQGGEDGVQDGDGQGGQGQQQVISHAPPPAAGGGGVANATSAGFASSTEALHLTLMLRRTLSELDSRSKHLNDSNLEKLQLHGEVEKCKVRLERLTIESEELQRRTEAAEARARDIIDDEAANVNAANARATAAEKRFEILVDWSRKEESKRMVAEETVTRALEKMEKMERTYNDQVSRLNSEITELSDALEKSNSSAMAKHKALVDRENELLECTKKLAVAEQLSRTSQSESTALKNLCGKIEVELEGTKSRLGSVEQAHMRDGAAMSEEVKALAKENKRLSEQAEEAISGIGQQMGHWKKVNENNERKLMNLLQEKDEWGREKRRFESKFTTMVSNEKTFEERIDFLAAENEDLKKKMWLLEQQLRDKDLRLRNQDSENKDLLNKNESLNRMVDGLEDDMMGKSRATGMHPSSSPSLLRYDVKPVF